MCPRNDESAGKRRSTRTRKGAPWLKTALVTAAWAAVRTKGSYLQGQFLRLKARRGAKKAILAVAASILTAVWHMLKNQVEYQDLGAEHFARRDPAALNGIQPKLRRLPPDLRHLRRTFPHCRRRVAYSSAIACTDWECSSSPSRVAPPVNFAKS